MLRFLLVLLLLAGPATAHSFRLPAVPDTAAAVPSAACTAADTVQALHRLFRQRRSSGSLIAGGSLATHFTLAAIAAAREGRGSSGGGGSSFVSGPLLHFGFGGYLAIFALLFVPITAAGLGRTLIYNGQREKKIVARYEATHHLPAPLRERAIP